MVMAALLGMINGRSDGVCAQMGVMCMLDNRGCEGDPPAEEEYAVEPNEVAVMRPSQMSLSTI